MYYQTQDTLDEFLGESHPPKDLTPELLTGATAGTGITRLEHFPLFAEAGAGADIEAGAEADGVHEHKDIFLRKPESGMSERLSAARQCVEERGICTCFAEELIPDSSLQELYFWVTGSWFLEPFGLTDRGSHHCHETELADVQKQLGAGKSAHASRDMSLDLPFPIFQTAVLAPYTGHGNTTIASFPVEHTPLYTGTPNSYSGKSAAPYEGIGDVLVSSFAWPGTALDAVPEGAKGSMRISQSHSLADTGALAEVAGIATAYVADFQGRDWGRHLPNCVITLLEKVLPHANIWSPLAVDRQGVPVTQNLPVGDAGIADDVGHIPLLRRGVKKMVIYTSAAVHDNATGSDLPNPCEMVYEIAAFGVKGCLDPPNPAGASQTAMAAGSMTVFDSKDFAPFWSEIQRQFAAGEPCVYRGTFTVVDNKFLGIKGGWKAEIVWAILLPSTTWRSALPSHTAAALSHNFPNYLAGEPKYRIVFSALSQYASWVTETKVLKELEAMLGSGKRPAEEASAQFSAVV